MHSIERAVKVGLNLVFAVLTGCSGDDRELSPRALTPDAGHEAPRHDAGRELDAGALPASNALIANAGPDQQVGTGTEVTLPGSGLDASGAALSYTWTQTAGAIVDLRNSGRALATFTSPLVHAELEFQLAVRSASGFASDTVKVTVSAGPVLLVANRGNSIVRYTLGPKLNGDVAPDATFSGTKTRLRSPSVLAVDSVGGLLVANSGSHRISGFSSAFGPGGDVIPERYVGGPTLPLSQPEGLAYDRARDLLFVSNLDSSSTINVWSGVSSAAFSGAVQPVRRLQSSALTGILDLELTASGELYVLSSGNGTIAVFPNAASLDGVVTPARTIRSPAFIETMDAFVDAGDRLYVVGLARTEVLVFDNASTLNGSVMPNRVLTLSRAHSFGGITVDAAGTAYVTDPGVQAVYAIDGVATKTGAITPDRTVVGAKTGLAAPGSLIVAVP